jgi:F-type H+-transporting ATPase subunit a
MSTKTKILYSVLGIYLLGLVVLVIIFGAGGHKNNEYKPQDEFKLYNWIHAGPFSINKAVVYLFLACILTIGTMLWIARRMRQRPNKVQTAVETLFGLMKDNITKGNMDDKMAATWFPFIGTIFLFIWYSNLVGFIPLPLSHEKFNLFGIHVPAFALYAATANLSIPLVLSLMVFIAFNAVGFRTHGFVGYFKSLIPAGVSGAMLLLIAPLEVISTFMRLISLTVRLFANILAGHMIILFMAGGLGVLLGLHWLGWFTLPIGIALYLFEVGLVATLQAFIFATLSAIYIGGAASHH